MMDGKKLRKLIITLEYLAFILRREFLDEKGEPKKPKKRKVKQRRGGGQ